MTEIFAHRGSKGTHPENTLTAFAAAVATGCEGIELDVQLSADQELVVLHDSLVDRTTNGHGPVYTYTAQDLQQLDAGSWFAPAYQGEKIPLLHEVLYLLKDTGFNGKLNIEVKTDEYDYPGIETKLVELVQSTKWDFTCLYSSFNWTTLERLAVLDSNTELAFISEGSVSDASRTSQAKHLTGFHSSIEWAKNPSAKGENYPKIMRPWTVNEPTDMLFCFQQQFTAIHTDFPAKALDVRQQYKQAIEE